MFAMLTNFRSKVLAGLYLVGACLPHAVAVDDVLDTPAAKTTMAHQYLLLDVAQAGSRLVAVGARGHILISENNGDSWRQVDTPVSVLLTALSFADDRHGWAVGHGGVILYTQDGGTSWEKQFDGDAANLSIIQQAEDVVERVREELDLAGDEDIEELEYQLEEAEFALEDAQIDAEVGASKPFLDVYFENTNVGFAVGAYGFLFRTVDGGKRWENYGARMDNIDRFHLNAITKLAGGTYVVAGEAGVMFRSEDQGESWETIDSPYDGSFFGLLATGEKDVVLAFGLRGNLFRSDDAGQYWEDVPSGTENTLMGGAVDASGQISIVGNSGTVLLSVDGGESFSETIRSNRLGNVSLVFIDEHRLALVGESGVSLTNPAGNNL